jgi:hypothetical protein
MIIHVSLMTLAIISDQGLLCSLQLNIQDKQCQFGCRYVVPGLF